MRFGKSSKRKHQQRFHQPAMIESLESRQLLAAVIESPVEPQQPSNDDETINLQNASQTGQFAVFNENANNQQPENLTVKEIRLHLLYAQMAQYAYVDLAVNPQPVPQEIADAGWTRTVTLKNNADGFYAHVFRHSDGRAVLAFAGTDPKSIEDLKTDIAQAVGLRTSQYTRAMREALNLKSTSKSVHFVGHSLGGGLAAAAAMVTNAGATTFNGAGVHRRTLDTFEYTDGNGVKHKGVRYNDRQIVAYRVLPQRATDLAADPLSMLQLAGSVEDKNIPQTGQLEKEGKRRLAGASKGIWSDLKGIFDGAKDATELAKEKLRLATNIFDLTGNDGTTVKVQPANSKNFVGIKAHSMTTVIEGVKRLLQQAEDAV